MQEAFALSGRPFLRNNLFPAMRKKAEMMAISLFYCTFANRNKNKT